MTYTDYFAAVDHANGLRAENQRLREALAEARGGMRDEIVAWLESSDQAVVRKLATRIAAQFAVDVTPDPPTPDTAR